MTQRRFHYEQAFEYYLRANRVPYLAVNEAKKTLLPVDEQGPELDAIKSFDFVVYAGERRLLVDVKGRMYGRDDARLTAESGQRFPNWVTEDDVEGLTQWQTLFGADYEAVFVFLYCLRQQPPDALFEEVFSFDDRWYALREAGLEAYRGAMRPRSASWRTVHVPVEEFGRISRPLRLHKRPTGRD